VEIVARLVRDTLTAFRGDAVVLSFDAAFVGLYRKLCPSSQTAVLTESPEGVEAAHEAGADAVAVGLRFPVSRLALPRARRERLGLYVWTVKTFHGFARALRWDADGVITDVPREACAAVDSIDRAAEKEFGGGIEDQKAYSAWRRKFVRQMKKWPVPA